MITRLSLDRNEPHKFVSFAFVDIATRTKIDFLILNFNEGDGWQVIDLIDRLAATRSSVAPHV